MSAVALKNRVISDSNSEAVFASCTTLPIHQTTLHVEEMAGIDGGSCCLLGEVLSTTRDVVDDAISLTTLYIFGGIEITYVYPPTRITEPPPPSRELKIITREPYSCDVTIAELASGATCPCMPPP